MSAPTAKPDPADAALRSVHTNTFAALLEHLGVSLVVSTYQAGKAIVLRAENGAINTHFRNFQKPMGIAVRGASHLTIGTAYHIWYLRNVPAVAGKLDPPTRHDACYLPRDIHITGDIDIHEMVYAGDELWFVNTRFSCLCTLDLDHSFVPRWRPPFVTAYDLSDRCHLNGLSLRDNQPRYVTALGATDTPGGWRADKAKGGILLDISTNETLYQGLSMPHSPRWYGDRLWVLESGRGSLAYLNLESGQLDTVVELPGFTRGLDFWGEWAFIGLSQVRETAVFSGLPITERLSDRICGVWVVNVRTGRVEAFLQFEGGGVREIFAVQVLPHRFPEIIDWDETLMGSSYVLPDAALAEVEISTPPAPPAISSPLPSAPAIDSFVVIVPVYNLAQTGEAGFRRTFASITASIDYFLKHYPESDRCRYEIAIVDDASTDASWDILQRLAREYACVKLARHAENRGLSAARNTGVNISRAQAIFFCDDDDLFLEPHILTALQALSQPLEIESHSPWQLPGNYPAAVRTQVKLADTVHPHWRDALRQTLALNLCIRREAHDLIGGFPEDDAFRQFSYGNEDGAYARWLTTLFDVAYVDVETVEYVRYPGNLLDRQLPRFQVAPGAYQEAFSERDRLLHAETEQIARDRQVELQRQARSPRQPDRYLALGNEAYRQRDLPSAARWYRQSLVLKPDWVEAQYNLGVAYLENEEWAAATNALERTLELDPNHADALNNLAIVAHRELRLSEAIALFRQAIALRYDFPDAHFNLGITLLQAGQYEAGWTEWEWRWRRADFTPLECPQPQWQGEDIGDRSLLVHTEQGAGDAIQFARYLPLAAQRCRRLLLCSTPNLVELFQGIADIDKLYTPGEISHSEFDTYLPLMSLPRVLGVADIPADVPYLGGNLGRDRRLDLMMESSLPKVGIVWAGSPTHKDDRNRSCRLSHFLPLLELEGLAFFSLQKGPQEAELAQLPTDIAIVDLSAYLHTFADTARAIAQLDLLIAVDTSVVHLAGALGKPVWTLLSYAPDWRWLCDRQDTPWYPTMRLFRQPRPKDWGSVFADVVTALPQWSATCE